VSIILDTSYLNRTPNKSTRQAGSTWLFVVWHETASPNPENPHGTLKYNLSATVQSSYHYLIARDGTIFHYVDERYHVAWHAGVGEYTLGTRITDLNGRSIGVELDGKNDGTPATPTQLTSAGKLAAFFKDAYGIALSSAYHVTHAAVALPKGRKVDPKCATIAQILQAASPAVDYAALWQPFEFHKGWGIPDAWVVALQANRSWGRPLTREYVAEGVTHQRFEQGIATWKQQEGVRFYRIEKV
jgi:N-acetylmuramoyl-L-alanine amidase